MKKIISILIVALVALAFMGCPTTYDDLPWGGSPVGDVVGDMNGEGLVLTSTGVPGVYKTATFTYDDDMDAWGGGTGVCNFKIRAEAGAWNGDYGWSGVTIGSLPSGVTAADNNGNIQLTDLSKGKAYYFTVTSTREGGGVVGLVEMA